MATVEKVFDIPFVKYANEVIDTVKVKLPLMLNNSEDVDIWAKLTIVGQGKYVWTFDDGTTEKVIQITANTSLQQILTIIPTNGITGTTYDEVIFNIEYYKNEALTQLYGVETLTFRLHIYMQNPDLTWTSDEFQDETQIVYEKWKATLDNLSTIDLLNNGQQVDIAGDLGNAIMRIYYWEERGGCYARVDRDVQLIEPENSAKFTLFAVDDWGARHTYTQLHWFEADGSTPIYDKILSLYVKNQDLNDCRVGVTSAVGVNDYRTHSWIDTVASGQVKKFTIIPFTTLTPVAWFMEYGRNTTGYAWIDGIYLFKKLTPAPTT